MGVVIKKKNWKLITLSLLFLLGGFTLIQVKYPVDWGILFYSGKSSPVLSEKVEIEKLTEDMVIHSVKKGICWASRGNTIFVSTDKGKSWNKKGRIPYSISNPSYFNRFFVIRKIFGRYGISQMKILNSGTILIFSGPYLWRSTDNGNSFKIVHRRKIHPLMQSWAEAHGEIFYGEYFYDKGRKEINLWKSIDDGKNWFIVYTFVAGSVRHIHAVQYDPYSDRIWVTTGDEDRECKIMYSTDRGKTFEIIGQGSQEWRAVSLLFTEDYIYWGMDSPHKQNYIFRWDRRTGTRKVVAEIDGPAYYSTQLEDGSLILATTVEGATGEWDGSAHIWLKEKNNQNWIDLGGWKKIYGAKMFGILKLAQPNESLHIYLTPLNTEGHYSIFKLKVKKD